MFSAERINPDAQTLREVAQKVRGCKEKQDSAGDYRKRSVLPTPRNH
jgi:hypothetical protein